MDLAKRRSIVMDGKAGDGPDALTFRFRPFRWTPQTKSLMEKALTQEAGGEIFAACETLAGIILLLVESWNLTDGGKPVPLTPDALRGLDYDLLFELIDDVTSCATPGSAERRRTRVAMNPQADTPRPLPVMASRAGNATRNGRAH